LENIELPAGILGALFEQASDAILIETEADGIVDVNRRACELTGYSREELLTRQVGDLIAPETRRCATGIVRYELEHFQGRPFETVTLHRDGHRIPTEVTETVVDGPDGTLVLAIVRDISERTRIEAAEREQRELAEAMRDTAAALNSTLNLDEVLDRILIQMVRVVRSKSANIMLMDADGRRARVVRHRGYRAECADALDWQVWEIDRVPNLRHLADAGEAVVVPDLRADPVWQNSPLKAWVRSFITVPIRSQRRLIGFLNLDSDEPGFFTPAHAERLRAFAHQAALALENSRLLLAARQRSAELEALRQAGLQLTSSLDLKTVLETILDNTLRLIAADDAHIFLYRDDRLSFGAALQADPVRDGPRIYREPRPNGLTYTVARHGQRIVVPDTNHSELFRSWNWGGGIVGLPLRAGAEVRGVMNVAFSRPHGFDADELRVLDLLADQATIAIENARLYETVRHHAEELEQHVAARTAELVQHEAALQAANESLRAAAQKLTELAACRREALVAS
jgi:PAS domain S-box-containing protein